MARNRTDTKIIFVHCAATRPRQDIGVRTIHGWHIKRGINSERGMSGYHFIVRRSGTVELGRELREIGAHVLGFNDVSIGICLVGGVDDDLQPQDNFKAEQFESLERIIKVLKRIWPNLVVVPHNEVSNKACPSFDVHEWMKVWNTESDELRGKSIIAEIERERDEE